jgi:hypothetical protein
LLKVRDVFGINGIDLMRGARSVILKISRMPAAGATTREISYPERDADFPESSAATLRLPTTGAWADSGTFPRGWWRSPVGCGSHNASSHY